MKRILIALIALLTLESPAYSQMQEEPVFVKFDDSDSYLMWLTVFAHYNGSFYIRLQDPDSRVFACHLPMERHGEMISALDKFEEWRLIARENRLTATKTVAEIVELRTDGIPDLDDVFVGRANGATLSLVSRNDGYSISLQVRIESLLSTGDATFELAEDQIPRFRAMLDRCPAMMAESKRLKAEEDHAKLLAEQEKARQQQRADELLR